LRRRNRNWPSSRLLSTPIVHSKDLCFREPTSSDGFRPTRTGDSPEDLSGGPGDEPLAPGTPFGRRRCASAGYHLLRTTPRAAPRGEDFGSRPFRCLVQIESNRYLELTDEALRFAAELWAESRRQGRPTSSAPDLDIDVILAAQALTLGGGAEVVVVTTNPRHLRQFVDARLWTELVDS
jgi:hypothetical protein